MVSCQPVVWAVIASLASTVVPRVDMAPACRAARRPHPINKPARLPIPSTCRLDVETVPNGSAS